MSEIKTNRAIIERLRNDPRRLAVMGRTQRPAYNRNFTGSPPKEETPTKAKHQTYKRKLIMIKCITSGNIYGGYQAAAAGEGVARWSTLATALSKDRVGADGVGRCGGKEWRRI